MTRVQADPALRDALTRNGERVEVCDEAGQVIGYAVTAGEMEKLQRGQLTSAEAYALADLWFTPEVLRQATADPRRYTMEEVFQRLGIE